MRVELRQKYVCTPDCVCTWVCVMHGRYSVTEFQQDQLDRWYSDRITDVQYQRHVEYVTDVQYQRHVVLICSDGW